MSSPAIETDRTARVLAVQEGVVTIEVDSDVPVIKNEVAYVVVGEQRLRAEVLRVRGREADLQVFEDTRGVKTGDRTELTGELLSVSLGPGLLGTVYDGLQNPLSILAESHGFFLPRGVIARALDTETSWRFKPSVEPGDRVRAGDVLGTTREGPFDHKILVPFGTSGALEVVWVESGRFTVEQPIARLRREGGTEIDVTMQQRWPVRRPIPERLLGRHGVERLYPSEPLTTTQRIVDTFFPIARGGTGCIPGPFGAGKTVLQSLIARYSTVDIVIIIACGERAGEVVETIHEYPQTVDPRTGGTLMDRTIIVCNTSSMPVAARESSIYTGITLGEYYRQMGYDVLCIADSTSRWAQAMRETSGRLEEIPGEEAYPAYLDSTIKSLYERAGVLRCPDGSTGSLTLIGTVSPAGGNFDEPVTQATLGTVKTFLGLSSERAYKRFYPAIDPLISWSRYLEQLAPWFERELRPGWVESVERLTELLHDGATIHQTMQVTGEEGISLEDFVIWQKSVLLDMVYLQQDAFDAVDASTPLERQVASLELLEALIDGEYRFEDKDEAREVFIRLTGLLKNLNYAPVDSPDHRRFRKEVEELANRYRLGKALEESERPEPPPKPEAPPE